MISEKIKAARINVVNAEKQLHDVIKEEYPIGTLVAIRIDNDHETTVEIKKYTPEYDQDFLGHALIGGHVYAFSVDHVVSKLAMVNDQAD